MPTAILIDGGYFSNGHCDQLSMYRDPVGRSELVRHIRETLV